MMVSPPEVFIDIDRPARLSRTCVLVQSGRAHGNSVVSKNRSIAGPRHGAEQGNFGRFVEVSCRQLRARANVGSRLIKPRVPGQVGCSYARR